MTIVKVTKEVLLEEVWEEYPKDSILWTLLLQNFWPGTRWETDITFICRVTGQFTEPTRHHDGDWPDVEVLEVQVNNKTTQTVSPWLKIVGEDEVIEDALE